MALSRVKDVDNKTKCTVFGYSREIEKKFGINLPVMIQYLFIVYYWVQERFAIHSDYLKIDNLNKNLIKGGLTYISGMGWLNYWTAYGADDVINIYDESIIKYQWKIRYKNDDGFTKNMIFGIVSSDEESTECRFTNSKYPFYSTDTNGLINGRYHPKSRTLKSNDMLTLIFDVKTMSLSCIASDCHDNEQSWVIKKNIDMTQIKYKLAISMCAYYTQQVELIDFTIFHNSDNI